MSKAKMVSKHTRGSIENVMELRSGEQGTGRIVQRVRYWPTSPTSISAARDILIAAAEREGLMVVYDNED